jgi:subtilisin family serine protease
VQAIQVSVRGGAYWDIVFTGVSQSVAGTLPPVSRKDASWWRAVHLDGSTYSGDRKMRVGVIDEGLLVEDPRLQHIANYGYDWNDDLQGVPARDSSHSYAVCSLLGARPESDDSAPAGVIPDAEILFCAAGAETPGRIDPARLALAIDWLSDEAQCDIITFSAGDSAKAIPSLRDSMAGAQRRGCLCFAAAGNKGGSPGYPARYDQCLSVGAVGLEGMAPPGTWHFREGALSTQYRKAPLFVWRKSAVGAQVKFLAAGLSVGFCQPDGTFGLAAGTSFAAPIAAGLAARILQKDVEYQSLGKGVERVKYALDCLTAHSANIFPGASRFGVLADIETR